MSEEAKNFFEEQREKLGLTATQMAARVPVSSDSVRDWEADGAVPRPPIAALAKAYQVSEQRMEKEVMALRRRLEAKRAALAG